MTKNRKTPKSRQPWTQAELDILKEYAGKLTPAQICRKFMPNRRRETINAKIVRMGLREPTRPRMDAWKPEEIEILKQHAGKISIEQLRAKYLPGRTVSAISARIIILGLTGHTNEDWTKSETDYIRKHYPTDTVDEIAGHLGRTSGAVATKAKNMKLRKKRNNAGGWNTPWTPEEDAILLKNQTLMTYEEIHEKLLPDRTVNAICIHCTRLERTKQTPKSWSKDEIEILTRNYAKTSREEMQALLPGRTQMAINAKAANLGLHKR